VNLEIDPEPTPDERTALAAALRRLVGEPDPGQPGAWWREGVREALEQGPEGAE